ncbi:fibronectin type 3 and ankyrin repeat domains 1 protein-like [Adelges cooleyi]|uniref:fibronectin type 3 and ankyrin repeat domains 1 protein-like n=1 Tax=Adelges cooleyi TaxID=133065 RepID=UPI00217F3598|nr:fibronectin type 3 and ankyrin repeat domains 1 protein-like [Adelges cooleyi]
MALKLDLDISAARNSVVLEWNKPPELTDALYQLEVKEKGRNWVVIYKGFGTRFQVNNLSGGFSYQFRLIVKPRGAMPIVVTASCVIKNEPPSITQFQQSINQNLPALFREFLDTRPKDINIYNDVGDCALSRACAAGHADMVLTLIQNGADVNLPNMFMKKTPLMTAAFHGRCDIIRILAHNNADAKMRDINNKTALHYAVDGSQNCAVEMLLTKKWSDVNAIDSKGWSPLMRAVIVFSNADLLRTLIDNGADLHMKDITGQDVWQLAHTTNNWEALKVLSS